MDGFSVLDASSCFKSAAALEDGLQLDLSTSGVYSGGGEKRSDSVNWLRHNGQTDMEHFMARTMQFTQKM